MVLGNETIKQEFRNSRKELETGTSLSDSLKNSKIIPPLMVNMLSVGEDSGLLEGSLKEMADTYEQDTNETMKTMTTLIEPIMILSIGLIVGGIVIAMLLPIFQMDMLAR